MAGPSAEEFAALVADLRAEISALNIPQKEAIRRYTQRPACFARYPWTSVSILLGDAERLTGYSRNTLMQYARRKDQASLAVLFPPTVTPDRKISFRYAVGDIAVWYVFRAGPRRGSRHHRFGVREKEHAPPRAGGEVSFRRGSRHKDTVAFLARAVTDSPALTLDEAKAACAAAGVHLPRTFAARWLDEARAAATPAILARFASPRPDGLVSLPEVAEVFGVPYDRVKRAVAARGATYGSIRAVRDGWQWWADPDRLRFRSEKSRHSLRRVRPPLPVDRDDPRAVPLPGDKEEAGRVA